MIKDLHWNKVILGIGFTFFIALLGYVLAIVPGFNRVGPLACAIILAVIYRQIFGYPTFLKAGIDITAKYILRLAIILYGLKLNINVIFEDGLGLLVKSIIAIIFAIFLMIYLAKWLKAEEEISLLLGIGTGICGAAAVAATAPILKAKEEDTAISIAIIALIGTVFSICYTLVMPILPISSIDFGIWSGLSLHELAHVALAAEPAGENELAIALLAKLTRVFLLVPVCFALIMWLKRKNNGNEEASIAFPYFLLGFIIMSLFGSYVVNQYIFISDHVQQWISNGTTFLLTSAMVGLGLNVSLAAIRTKALKPLLAMIITSIALSVVMILLTSLF